MDEGSHPVPDDDSSHVAKRRKTSHGNTSALKKLAYDQYTIAWICALHIEMAAARAVLDEIHQKLPVLAGDSNNYVMGSIQQHNIVIACLPAAQYGTNNAANVMTNLKRSFPSIVYGLMVGIGGGIPTKADIRLGDIVIGTRVTQHDMGKIVGDGQLKRTGVPKLPAPFLSTAVSSLRSTHELEPSRVPSILRAKFAQHPEYRRPSVPDRLFKVTYPHKNELYDCEECDSEQLVHRDPRSSHDPVIHYGGIASGNQVMRYSSDRDDIARELDVLCFEMEAAGLMDILACLSIRGICDYSDSHKSKEWQRYAAAAAAAYTKELLEQIPPNKSQVPAVLVLNDPHPTQLRRENLLNSLKFDQLNARRDNIETEHRKTCEWLIDHASYRRWLDHRRLSKHGGLLWLNGKAGSGKSTIMRFLCRRMEKAHKDSLVISFFFHARGELIEKSLTGLYRTLLFQLLNAYPDLQKVLDKPEIRYQSENGWRSLYALKGLFSDAILGLGQRPLVCLVDALDECDEQQILDMVQHFEGMAEQSEESNMIFRVCFSSRPYPYIPVKRAVRLTIEDQKGHSNDLAVFVRSRLRINNPELASEIQSEIVQKAGGIFLWAVLVVSLVNKENRLGLLALKKRLSEVPKGLNELYREMLQRDDEHMGYFRLGILWTLFAARPLGPREYYHAMWISLLSENLVDDKVPPVTLPDSNEVISNFVITSSKGLIEVTRSEYPAVQFIHESLRDFLLKDNGIRHLWPEYSCDWEGHSHDRLGKHCETYIKHHAVQALIRGAMECQNAVTDDSRKFDVDRNVGDQAPLLYYAMTSIFYHSDRVAKLIRRPKPRSLFPMLNYSRLCPEYQLQLYESEDEYFLKGNNPGLVCVDVGQVTTRLISVRDVNGFHRWYKGSKMSKHFSKIPIIAWRPQFGFAAFPGEVWTSDTEPPCLENYTPVANYIYHMDMFEGHKTVGHVFGSFVNSRSGPRRFQRVSWPAKTQE